MLHDLDLDGVLDLINSKKNPELWHVANKTHPGIGWSIKTVMPKYEHADDDTIDVMEAWSIACGIESHIVTITPAAYDWDGNLLEQWQTIWIRDGWDINIEDGEDGGSIYRVTTAKQGYTNTAMKLLDEIAGIMAQSDDDELKAELSELMELCDAIASQVTNEESQRMRRNIRLLDD